MASVLADWVSAVTKITLFSQILKKTKSFVLIFKYYTYYIELHMNFKALNFVVK